MGETRSRARGEVALPPVPAIRARVFSPVRSKASLRAAATPATKSRREGRQLFQPWQADALGLFDRVGACHFPAIFHGSLISPIRLFLGRRDENGEIEEIPDESGILTRLEDPGGGHASLLSRYATLRFLVGESYLLQTVDKEDPDGEKFEIVSPLELRLKGTTAREGYQRIRAPGLTPEELLSADDDALDLLDIGEARVWRFHRQHPTYSDWADSPVRSLLHLYEELELLHLEAKSALRSRIARAGILFIDGRITFTLAGPGEEDESEAEGVVDEDPEADELMDALIEAIIAAISDQDSPASIAPILARVENNTGLPLKDLIYHWVHQLEQDFPSTERIEKLHGWIAQGIDLPPEVMLGFTDTNHWNAFLIDDQTWEAHGKPDAVAFCQDITEAYVRPKAAAETLADWENVVCWYDPAEVTTDPDRSKAARELFIDGELKGDSYRGARGFGDDDAPTEEERRRYAAFKLRDASLLPEDERPVEEEAPAEDADVEEPIPEGDESGEPPPQLVASSNGDRGLDDALRGAAEAALVRGREVAGSRLRAYVLGDSRSNDPDCADCIQIADGVPNASLAAVLGADRLRLVEAPDIAVLVAGTGLGFSEVATRLGLDPERASEVGALIEDYAAATLCEEDPPAVPL